ncbi:metallophosphoesterase family protein [Flavitalea sp.]|nr:metallophosphoesterase family protein [Flavitalea sp.]
MRLAIISDIHGNLPALKAVLNDIDSRDIDQIVCLGDLVDFAPWPNEVIHLIRTSKIMTIMGNHDERIAFDLPIIPLSKHSEKETIAREKAINHSKNSVTADNKAYLASLQKSIIIQYENVKLHFTHASPEGIDEYLYEDEESLEKRLLLVNTDFLLIGHTHLSYIKDFGNKKVINTGSVGRSKETDRKAAYSIVGVTPDSVTAEIVKVDYPIIETANAIYNSDIPDFYADFLLFP